MLPDGSVLAAMGVTLSPGPVPIPLYAQKECVPVDDRFLPGLVVYRAVDVDPELQMLMSLVLQVTDGDAFRRYVIERKRGFISFNIAFTLFKQCYCGVSCPLSELPNWLYMFYALP